MPGSPEASQTWAKTVLLGGAGVIFRFQEFRVSGAERGTFGLGSPALLHSFMDLGNFGPHDYSCANSYEGL